MRTVAILLIIILVVGIMAAFAGFQPLATYKDNVVNGITTLLAQYKLLKSSTPKAEPTAPSTPKGSVTYQLNGTYTATIVFGIEQTATFDGNTVTFYNRSEGKRIYEYFIPGGLESGQVIRLTYVVTGETRTVTFKYNMKYDCVTIEGDTYYR